MNTRRSPCWQQAVLIAALLSLFPAVAKAQLVTQLESPYVLRACGHEATRLSFNFFAQLLAPVYWYSPTSP